MKDYSREYYPILFDRYVLLVWMVCFSKKNSLKPGMKFGIEKVKVDLKANTV